MEKHSLYYTKYNSQRKPNLSKIVFRKWLLILWFQNSLKKSASLECGEFYTKFIQTKKINVLTKVIMTDECMPEYSIPGSIATLLLTARINITHLRDICDGVQ